MYKYYGSFLIKIHSESLFLTIKIIYKMKRNIIILSFFVLILLLAYLIKGSCKSIRINLPQQKYLATILAENATPSHNVTKITGTSSEGCIIKLIHPQNTMYVNDSLFIRKGKIDTTISGDWYANRMLIEVFSKENCTGYLNFCVKIN